MGKQLQVVEEERNVTFFGVGVPASLRGFKRVSFRVLFGGVIFKGFVYKADNGDIVAYHSGVHERTCKPAKALDVGMTLPRHDAPSSTVGCRVC